MSQTQQQEDLQDEAAPQVSAAGSARGPETSGEPTPQVSAAGSAGGPETSGEPTPRATAATPGGPEVPLVVPPGNEHMIVASRRRETSIRTVDFSQPTKFTAELRRRIVRVLGPFCEAFSLRLSTELRAPVELAVTDSSQLTWSAAKAQLSANALAVALEVAPIERQMLLCIEPPLILQALECLLGGAACQAPPERRLSEVDWALTKRLLQSLTAQLSPAWRDLGGLELGLGEVDLEGDAGVIVPIGEPTFALTFESRIDSSLSSMCLLIPWSAIEPVAEEVLGGGPQSRDADPGAGRAVNRGLAGAHVCLRAEVGALQMPVERMLALTPGSALALEERAEDGVQLYAEGVPLGHARPGLRGARRAVKLTETIVPGAGVVQSLPADTATAAHAARAAAGEQMAPTHESLARMMGVHVRVWVELGRTAMPLGDALELPPGSVLELDQGAEDPIELFVNGMRFAHGTLQVGGGGEWAVHIDALV